MTPTAVRRAGNGAVLRDTVTGYEVRIAGDDLADTIAALAHINAVNEVHAEWPPLHDAWPLPEACR